MTPAGTRGAGSNGGSFSGACGSFAPVRGPTTIWSKVRVFGPNPACGGGNFLLSSAPTNCHGSHTAARLGDPAWLRVCHDGGMTTDLLTTLSNLLADAVAAASPSVVQVQGRRRPASGLVYADNVVLTTVRALGRDDGLHVRAGDGRTLDAELAGFDPTTGLAVLRVADLDTRPIAPSSATPRVGHLALAVARSWSNVVTASAGILSVIGGPLPTGRRQAIDQVYRTSAPMHDGFAGGAFLDSSGGLLGITTSTEIRGSVVVIPASIALAAVVGILKHGGMKRGYLGIAGQPVVLPEAQRAAGDREEALLVVAVTPGSPAAQAGVLVGDIVTGFDGQPVESPEDLLDLLTGDRTNRTASLRVIRGGTAKDIAVTVGERPAA
jgi:serine protease DegQ